MMWGRVQTSSSSPLRWRNRSRWLVMMGKMDVSAELVNGVGTTPAGSCSDHRWSAPSLHSAILGSTHLLSDVQARERVFSRQRRGRPTAVPLGRLVDPQEVVLEPVVQRALLVEARVESLEVGRDGAVGCEELLVRDLQDVASA